VRQTSVTALQALAMLNNRFVVRQSEHFAARLEKESRGDLDGQIDLAYELALNRKASEAEKARLGEYAKRFGLANACRVILNSNEFIFVN
jgi:hypothetical protein